MNKDDRLGGLTTTSVQLNLTITSLTNNVHSAPRLQCRHATHSLA